MLVLALDTSTPTVTAGVVVLQQPDQVGSTPQPVAPAAQAGGALAVLSEHTVTDPFAHAERLMPLARAALAGAGQRLAGVEAVVVGLGPGPFTGLRVGIATAAALGDALDIPVHGVPSHDGMARTLGPLPGDLLVVTDARRREVYLSGYHADRSRVLGPLVAAPLSVSDLLAGQPLAPTVLVGAGAPLVAAALGSAVTAPTRPLSRGLVELAAAALLAGAVPGPLTPLYLRRPDATEPGARRSVLGR